MECLPKAKDRARNDFPFWLPNCTASSTAPQSWSPHCRIATVPAPLNRSQPNLQNTWTPNSEIYFVHSPKTNCGSAFDIYQCSITTTGELSSLNAHPAHVFTQDTGSFLSEVMIDATAPLEAKQVHSLTNGPSSLNLCISALISLGLCSAAHWLKGQSAGIVPEWFHGGGPHQIGHSHAVMSTYLRPGPACCFAEPVVETTVNLTSRHRRREVVSSWRESQFTPDLLSSRGPPAPC